MTSKKWGPGNPLYDWQQRKLNKSAKRHKSPVRHMTKRRTRRFSFRKRRSGRKDRRVSILTAAPALIGLSVGDTVYGAGTSPWQAIQEGRFSDAVNRVLINMIGYNMDDNTWSPLRAKYLQMTIIGALASKGLSMLGVNKQIRKVPVVGRYIKL